jgi:hypothetical protein
LKFAFNYLHLSALWKENLCAGLKVMSKIAFYAIIIIIIIMLSELAFSVILPSPLCTLDRKKSWSGGAKFIPPTAEKNGLLYLFLEETLS